VKHAALFAVLFAALLSFSACKRQQNENEAIRAAIMQHLSGLKSLNLSAMEMDLKNVAINGDQAHAEAEFRPKTGAPPGAGMQVSYNLEKRDGAWVVLKSQTAGGMIQHPDPGQNPHSNSAVHPGSLPNFSDVLNPGGAPSQGNLPPRHPPINPQTSTSQPSGTKPAPPPPPR
jgi:hypothetical protein